ILNRKKANNNTKLRRVGQRQALVLATWQVIRGKSLCDLASPELKVADGCANLGVKTCIRSSTSTSYHNTCYLIMGAAVRSRADGNFTRQN
ncbi:hypothetical protein PC121_g16721, partial [Phytophthora cactorum]